MLNGKISQTPRNRVHFVHSDRVTRKTNVTLNSAGIRTWAAWSPDRALTDAAIHYTPFVSIIGHWKFLWQWLTDWMAIIVLVYTFPDAKPIRCNGFLNNRVCSQLFSFPFTKKPSLSQGCQVAKNMTCKFCNIGLGKLSWANNRRSQGKEFICEILHEFHQCHQDQRKVSLFLVQQQMHIVAHFIFFSTDLLLLFLLNTNIWDRFPMTDWMVAKHD